MVEKYLKELLYDYDCVIVPGLGGFIATYMEAEISIAKSKISPPRKQIAFNEKLIHNDNLLSGFIAENENITIEAVNEQIHSYVSSVKSTISSQSQYTIESLGRFYLNNEGVNLFEQYIRFNYLKDSFGLPDLYFKPIDRTQDSKVLFKQKNKLMATTNTFNQQGDDENKLHGRIHDEDEMEEVDIEEFERLRKEKKAENLAIYYVMAVLALVLTAGTAYYLNMDKTTYAIGEFNPMALFSSTGANPSGNVENKLLPSDAEAEAQTSDADQTESGAFDEPVADAAPTKLKPQKAIIPIKVNIDPENLISGRTGRYYIVVGGFKNKSKAATLLSTLLNAGNTSKIIDSYQEKGVYRVTLADFATYEEAASQKQAYTDTYGGDLWVLGY